MRPIDADALSKKLCETTIFIKDGEAFQRIINDVPTIDAVEVVRCKDCIYYHPSFCEIWSKYGTVQTRKLGYCYMGERREDGEA